MDALQYGFWYSKGHISFPDRQDTWLPAKYAPHRISAEAPHLRDIGDAIVALAVVRH